MSIKRLNRENVDIISTKTLTGEENQLLASIPNGKYVEFQIENPLNTELLPEPFEIKDGYIEVPAKLRFGIELSDKF